jgi:hypothetical protein
MNRVIAILFLSGLGLGLFMFDGDLLPSGEMNGDAASLEDFSGSPEACKWLSENESDSALASNRFGSTETAIQFVNELYRAGARRIVVPEEAIDDDGVEIYCDSLVVIMPTDGEKRRRVRAICDREIRREGFDPREDGDADQVYLWWD